MNLVFLDASPLYSLNTSLDQYHLRAKTMLLELEKMHTNFLTTDYVIDETSTALIETRKGGYRNAINFLNWIFKSTNNTKIEWMNKERFLRAKIIFERFNNDKEWSFTDCTNYVVIKELKIKKVFTFDEHFKQMGFEVV